MMNRPVRASPITPAFQLASIASAPSVGPTVRCSMVSTGTGSAPPLMRMARFCADCLVEVAGDLGRPAADTDVAGHARVDLRRGDHFFVQHDRGPSGRIARLGTRRLRGHLGPGALALAVEVDGDEPATSALWIGRPGGVGDSFAGERGGSEAEQLPALVLEDPLALLGLLAGLGDAEYRMERELRGPADHAFGLARVLQTGQFDDDPPVTRLREARLGDTQRVYPAAEDLDGPAGRLGVGLGGRAVVCLQHDLRTAAQVEPEPRRRADREVERAGEDDEREDCPVERGAGHDASGGITWIGTDVRSCLSARPRCRERRGVPSVRRCGPPEGLGRPVSRTRARPGTSCRHGR